MSGYDSPDSGTSLRAESCLTFSDVMALKDFWMTLRVGIYLLLLFTRTHAFGCTCITLVTPVVVVGAVVTSVVNGTTPRVLSSTRGGGRHIDGGRLSGSCLYFTINAAPTESLYTTSVVQATQD